MLVMTNPLYKIPAIRAYIENTIKARKSKKVLARLPLELDEYEKLLLCEIYVSGITMEPLTRLINTALSIVHVIEQGISGDFVECGVFKGGQGALAAGIFKHRKQQHRKVLLFDTYTGAPEPGEKDVRISTGEAAITKWRETNGNWMKAGVEEVAGNLARLDVLTPNVRFIPGDVRVTMQCLENIPDCIAVLRLDTNQYDSTRAELETLYPRMSPSGILIINDYGFWAGTKQAVDEYFSDPARQRPFLLAVDTAARFGAKP